MRGWFKLNRFARLGAFAALFVLFGWGCSGVDHFVFQRLSYFDDTVSQAQLGNIGITTADSGAGFQRGAFLSDCGIGQFPVSVDTRVPRLETILANFGSDATLASVSPKLGFSAEELERMSVLVLSLNEVQLASSVKHDLSEHCRIYVQENGGFVRLVTSVALLVDLPELRRTDVDLRVGAELGARGAITITADGLEKPVSATVSPDSVFAYRYSRFCWRDGGGANIVLRTDDPKYTVCPRGYASEPSDGWRWRNIRGDASSSRPRNSTGAKQSQASWGEPTKSSR
mgnify:CR=1 FL=1